MSALLINEPPLQVLPTLAVAIGLNESIFVQQLHYFNNLSNNVFDGRKWTYNTLKNWQEVFKFWSIETVKRTIKNVEKLGLVISTDKYNKMKMDKTKWYAINYDKLAEIQEEVAQKALGQNELSIGSDCSTPLGQNDQMTLGQNDQSNNQRIKRSIPKNNPLPPKGESADADVCHAKNKIEYQAIIDSFNDVFADTPVSKVKVLNDERKKQLNRLAKELESQFDVCSVVAFTDYFLDFKAQAINKPWYFGQNERKWIADIGYISRPSVFAKTVENAL